MCSVWGLAKYSSLWKLKRDPGQMPRESLGQPGPSSTTVERTPQPIGIGFISGKDHSVSTYQGPIAFQQNLTILPPPLHWCKGLPKYRSILCLREPVEGGLCSWVEQIAWRLLLAWRNGEEKWVTPHDRGPSVTSPGQLCAVTHTRPVIGCSILPPTSQLLTWPPSEVTAQPPTLFNDNILQRNE